MRTGPPIAPRRMASAAFAALSASSVKGEPVASIEACKRIQLSWFSGEWSWGKAHTPQKMILKIKFDLWSFFLYHA